MGVKPLRQKYAKAFIAVQNIAKTKNDDLFHEISIHLCGRSAALGGQATRACFVICLAARMGRLTYSKATSGYGLRRSRNPLNMDETRVVLPMISSRMTM